MMPQTRSFCYYRYKCEHCGTPHRHRNSNKYPNLCKPCAIKQMHHERKTNGYFDKIKEEATQ